MTDFQSKRIAYFIKAAKAGDWVQLGKEDAEVLEELLRVVYGIYP